MATSMAAALVASLPTPQTTTNAAPVPASEKIPASMAKFVDVEAEIPVTSVQLDGLVVMKIIKHGRESTSTAAGLLLGLDLDGTLEVSNSFALPISSDHDDKIIKTSGGRYETAMLRALKEVQSDDEVVGFYQSTTMGAFLRQSLISTQASHHDTLRHGGIALVHDVSQTARGNASLRAFRLTKPFLAAHKAGKFSAESLIEHKLTFSHVLEELPVTVRNSVLLNSFLSALSTAPTTTLPGTSISTAPSSSSLHLPSYTVLDVPPPSSLTRNMESLLETLDLHKTEENNVAYHSRQIAREKQKADAYVAKKREDNAARVAQGLNPLPEDDVSRLFKIPPEPSRLETTLLLGQLDGYAKSLESVTAAGLVKLYAAKS